MKKILGLTLAVAVLLCGCSSGVTQEEYDAVVAERDELAARVTELETAITEYNAYLDSLFTYEDNNSFERDEVVSFDEQAVLDALEVNQYSCIGEWNNYHIVTVKNTSEHTLNVSGAVKFYDADGNLIGAGNTSMEAVGPGVETLLEFYPDDPFETAETEISVSLDEYYESVVEDLLYESVPANEKEIISVTNNGEFPAEFVQCYVLFFNGDSMVDFEQNYMVDNDSELKPGKTVTKEFSCYVPYDSIKVFFAGRR